MPYYPQIPNIDKINGVNSPKKYTMTTRTCNHILKCGPNKGNTCSSQGFLHFDNKTKLTTCLCLKHWNLQQKFKNKEKSPMKCVKIKKNKPTLSKLEESLYKKYRVVDLKNILRENKQKLSGNKYDLIKRVILKKLF